MKRLTDEEVSRPLYSYDAAVRAENGCFAGVDEAGRGPLCGPVCVAACILDPDRPVWGINDSKKLTEKSGSSSLKRSRPGLWLTASSLWGPTSSTGTTSCAPPWTGCARRWNSWR